MDHDDDDIRLLIGVLPDPLQEALHAHPTDALLEVVLDLGRPPEARLTGGAVRLAEAPVSAEQLADTAARVGAFGDDNRAGIERTLHRISAIRNRRGDIVGLTLRVGRAVRGTIDALRDLVDGGSNLLLLGRPGVGKTTKLREMARVLADDLGKRVMIVDTSNEIGGDGDVPHPGIGTARRMQVPRPDRQHDVMIEAVENHMPEVIVIDEVGTIAEAQAARTIAERGVQLIATAHGTNLENLVSNPTLADLVGGVQVVTLGDEEARRRGSAKTQSERRGPPTFDVVVELVDRDEVVVHRDTAEAVDRLLAGQAVGGERRVGEGRRFRLEVLPRLLPLPRPSGWTSQLPPRDRTTRLYVHGIDREAVRRAIRDLPVDVRMVGAPESADLVLALKARSEDPLLRRIARDAGAPIHLVKRSVRNEVARVLRNALFLSETEDPARARAALEEAEDAARRARAEDVEVELAPQPPEIRALQHRLLVRHRLEAVSDGSEPDRHLVVLPPRDAEE